MRDVQQGVDVQHVEDPRGEGSAADADARAGDESRRAELEHAVQREPSFLSTRLLRELIAADARCDGARADRAARAAALLDVVLSGLELAGGAIVLPPVPGEADEPPLAARGIADHARELLEAHGPLEALGGSLARRAMAERRVFFLDRSTRDPLMPALRESNPEIECAAIVPLHDQEVAAAALVLAARAGRLSAPLLRSLAVAFRLLGVLLGPGRGRPAAPPRNEEAAQGTTDQERYLFEIEELGARLAEVRETARAMEDRAISAEAALRAESEASRARVAELEARLASETPDAARVRELEDVCAVQAAAIEEREQRIATLEAEVVLVAERAEQGRLRPGGGNGATDWDEAPEDDRSAGEEASVELPDNGGDVQLGDIAEAAAAALEQGPEDVAPDQDGGEEVDLASDTEGALDAALHLADAAPEAASAETGDAADQQPTEEPVVAHAILHVDGCPENGQAVRAAAEAASAPYWSGDGPLPRAATRIALVNLLDAALSGVAGAEDDLWSADRWIVYGTDAESGVGFDLGATALLRRPIDPQRCVEQIQRRVGRKLGGIVMVSAQLRELAGLRQRLHEIDAAGSVACDTRQALDLLEIVRRPDAIVVDLALPQGQGLVLAAQLRRQSETSDLPLLLLLPHEPDPGSLRADAERAQLLGPFVAEDVRRLVRAALAGRH